MNTLAEKTPPKTGTSPEMKVSWINKLMNNKHLIEQEQKEQDQDSARMDPAEVKALLEKEKNAPEIKPDLDAKVIDFKYEKPDPSQFKNASTYFKAKDNPSAELVNKNFENIKNSSYGGVGKIMQKIEDVGNSPKAQFVDEQNFIDQQIKEGSLKLADPYKNMIFDKNNPLEKKSRPESILRLGNSMKSITADSMSGSIILALDRAKMLEKIQAGHAKGYTYNVLHIPGSPDFTLQEIKNVNGVLKKEVSVFHIVPPDAPQKITPARVESPTDLEITKEEPKIELTPTDTVEVLDNSTKEEIQTVAEEQKPIVEQKENVPSKKMFVQPVNNSEMLGAKVLKPGLKFGSDSYDYVKNELAKKFGNKQETSPEKTSQNKEVISTKTTGDKKPSQPKEIKIDSLSQENKDNINQLLEEIYEGKIDGENKKSWDKIKKLPLDKFLNPEKYEWDNDQDSSNKFPIGEVTLEKYSPSAKKLYEYLKNSHEKTGYNEVAEDISVEDFIKHLEKNNLIITPQNSLAA